MPQLHELGTDECLVLLRSGHVGRFAVQAEHGPLIIPVNYTVRLDAVVVRTTPHGVLATYGADAPVAFEVDGVDDTYWTGWSVLARGTGELLASEPVMRGPAAARPWADGERTVELSLRWSELSGRRLGSRWGALSGHRGREARS